MNKIGTIRRIDELGRIVIPKVIRNKMRIKEGDRIFVTYDDENDIINVSKHDSFIKNIKEIEIVIDALSKEIHYPVALCSKEKIVVLNNDFIFPELFDVFISTHVQNELENRKTCQFVHEDLASNNKFYNFYVYPIAYDSELLGGLLIFSSTPLSNEDNKIIITFRNLITSFIKH